MLRRLQVCALVIAVSVGAGVDASASTLGQNKADAACRRGKASGCRIAAQFLYPGPRQSGFVVKRAKRVTHPAKALRLYVRSCKLGSARSCSDAGWLYASGTGTRVRKALARRYHKRATRQLVKSCKRWGYEDCVTAARRISRGIGAKLDFGVAIRYAKRACSAAGKNSSSACGFVGNLYYDAGSLHRDVKLSRKYRKRACEGGVREYCPDSGMAASVTGRRGPKNGDLSATWLSPVSPPAAYVALRKARVVFRKLRVDADENYQHAVFQKAVKAVLSKLLKRCRRVLAKPGASTAGRVALRLHVATSGKVTRARARAPGPAIARCIELAYRGARFPRPKNSDGDRESRQLDVYFSIRR